MTNNLTIIIIIHHFRLNKRTVPWYSYIQTGTSILYRTVGRPPKIRGGEIYHAYVIDRECVRA